jgi:hypothetical protein
VEIGSDFVAVVKGVGGKHVHVPCASRPAT